VLFRLENLSLYCDISIWLSICLENVNSAAWMHVSHEAPNSSFLILLGFAFGPRETQYKIPNQT
jgi:hypothetical protein